MRSRGKRIDSQRFPQPEMEDEQYRQAAAELEAVKKTPLWASFQEYLRRLEEDSVYVLRPDKLAGCRRFLSLAQTLSQEYRIDMDITEYGDSVCVDLHLYYDVYEGERKRILCQLLDLCDSVHSFRFHPGPWDFTLALEYRTHDRYRSGSRID